MKRFLWFALGVALVAAGLTLALTSPATESADFGWFAYTPLEDGDTDWAMGWAGGDDFGIRDRAFLVSGGSIVGVAVAVLGLLVLVAGLAYLWARRVASRAS